MHLHAAGLTDVGLKRTHNEDAFLLLPEAQLVCVADGMGGHASGEVAARIAVEELGEFIALSGRDEEVTWPWREEPGLGREENRLLNGVRLANLRIFERSQGDARLRGMGTTLVCALFERDGAAVVVGHVGDSRAYLWRGGRLAQLTEDHSLLNDLLRARRLTPEEAEAFPHKNVIVRALGMKETVEVDLTRLPLQEGDLLLLCCDGLSGMLRDEQMAALLERHPGDLEGCARALVAAANDAGGADNITCVLAQVHPSRPPGG